MATIATFKNDDNETLTLALTEGGGQFEITATFTTDGQVTDESIVFAAGPTSPDPRGDAEGHLDALVREYQQDDWTLTSRRRS